jgi:hypothetical protein
MLLPVGWSVVIRRQVHGTAGRGELTDRPGADTRFGTSEHVCTLDTTQRIDLASSSLRCRNGRPRLIGSAISLGENRFQRRVGDRNGNRRRRDGRRGGRSKSHGASRHGPSLFLTYRAGQCPDDDEGAGGYHQSWQLHALVPVRFHSDCPSIFHSDCPSIRLPLLRPPARRPLERADTTEPLYVFDTERRLRAAESGWERHVGCLGTAWKLLLRTPHRRRSATCRGRGVAEGRSVFAAGCSGASQGDDGVGGEPEYQPGEDAPGRDGLEVGLAGHGE